MTPSMLPEIDRRTLEFWLRQFDEGWDDGRLKEFVTRLPAAGTPLRRVALVELIKLDLKQQWTRGRRPRAEGYLHAFPELGTPADASELIQAEIELRQRYEPGSGPPPTKSHQPGPIPTPVAAHPLPPIVAGELPEQFGHYRIIKKLGQGGMGTVYLARDLRLDRSVALKVPRFSDRDDSAVLDRFYQEVKAVAQLDHPNICAVYEVNSFNDVHYMTMAYIEGRPMSALIRPGKPWTPRSAVLMIRKLALIVHEAHRKGIVHRDLKPSNIMINQRKEPVIMDFGLARRSSEDGTRLTLDGQAMGTPGYMAPEQARGDVSVMGPPCDVYSLGVMLYELLAGRLPFRGSAMEVLGQVLHAQPARPSEWRPGIDPALDALCLRAMAKDPAKRFASAVEFANALKKWIDIPTLPTAELDTESVDVALAEPAQRKSAPKHPPAVVTPLDVPERVEPVETVMDAVSAETTPAHKSGRRSEPPSRPLPAAERSRPASPPRRGPGMLVVLIGVFLLFVFLAGAVAAIAALLWIVFAVGDTPTTPPPRPMKKLAACSPSIPPLRDGAAAHIS